MKKTHYDDPMEYYSEDKELEKRRDHAVEHDFSQMSNKEIFGWANELATFFQLGKQKFDDVHHAEQFIRAYYKR